jgi:hypothetical protein
MLRQNGLQSIKLMTAILGLCCINSGAINQALTIASHQVADRKEVINPPAAGLKSGVEN